MMNCKTCSVYPVSEFPGLQIDFQTTELISSKENEKEECLHTHRHTQIYIYTKQKSSVS